TRELNSTDNNFFDQEVAHFNEIGHVSVFIQVKEANKRTQSDEKIRMGLEAEFDQFLENSVSSTPNGRIIEKVFGTFFLEFNNTLDAVRCALKLGEWCTKPKSEFNDGGHLSFRSGVNIGKVHETDGNLAQELALLAGSGEVIVPENVQRDLAAGLDCVFMDVGDHHFSGYNNPIRCYKALPRTDNREITSLLDPEDLLPTIAVIPFTSRSASQDTQVIGEVFADDIISLLSRSLELNVISRLSTTEFRHRRTSLAEIGSVLSADFVLTGRYTDNSGKIVIVIELSEVKSGRILWTDQTEQKIVRVLDTTDIVDWIVSNVRRSILNREVSRARSNPVRLLKNHTLLMSAVSLMHRLLPTDFDAARVLLENLMERMPNQPTPLAWMARWHVLRVQQGWTEFPEEDAAAALSCTKRALDLDPENVLALVSEGFVLTNLLRQLDEAEVRYDKALEISPNDAVGRLLRGTLFAFRGEGARAMRDTERSLHLTPLDPQRFFFLSLSASACIAAEDYERALKLSDWSLRANSTHTSTLRVKAVAQMRLNQVEEARRTGEKLMKLQPNLRVSDWLRNSPSREFPVGRAFFETLKEIGIPN
ncbi:MAG: hypothetical protein ABJP82_21140, partial [Hyphomicrobiales bacterium]